LREHGRRAFAPIGLLLLLLSGACAGEDGTPRETVARVAGWTLTTDRLAELLVLAQPFPLEEDQVATIVRHWVEMAAFAQGAVEGRSFLDDELMAETKWNEIREEILAEFRAREFAEAVQIRPEDMDSVYAGNEVRAVAHMLRRAGEAATQEQRREQYAWAVDVGNRLVAGSPWSEAREVNQHVESRERGGLMLVRRDQNLPQVTEVAFALRPGELSDVFASPDGYHLLVRPRLDEVRTAFSNLLAEEEMAAAQAGYVESLAKERALAVTPGAATTMREVDADPLSHVNDPTVLAEFSGGAFTAGQAARLLHLLPEEIRPELLEGPDWGVEDFVRQLALQELLWSHIEALGLGVSDPAMEAIREQYRSDLEGLLAALELDPEEAGDAGRGSIPPEGSVRRAFDLYLENVVARTRTLEPVPTFLAIRLLNETEWEIDPEGIRLSLETAHRLLELAGYEEVR
jgi:hypothetical protein